MSTSRTQETASVQTFQIPLEAAESYEQNLVPMLFAEWGQHLVDAAGVISGQRLLDVACGTGAATRVAADTVGPDGSVVGLDLNENMLVVARRFRADIEWRRGDAAALPFGDASFDAVLCASGLMFFPDVAQSLAEMARVLRPGGTVATQTWASTDAQAGYGPMIDVVARHAGADAVGLVNTYFRLGDLEQLSRLFTAAGLAVSSTRTLSSMIELPSVDALVRSEIESTPLIDQITDAVYERILEDARVALHPFCSESGELHMPITGHIVVARPA
ncbi:MAG: methyltransferase domain-containing protein [Candidatus Nanopelagicales bacterium]